MPEARGGEASSPAPNKKVQPIGWAFYFPRNRGSNHFIQQSGGRSGIAGWMAMGRRECPFVQTAPPQSRLINAVPALPRGEPSPSGKNVGDGLPESRWYAAIPAGWWNTGKRGVGDAAPYKLLYGVTLCVTAFLFQNLCKSLLTFPRNLI